MADKKHNNKKNYSDDDYNPKFRKPKKKVCVFCEDETIEINYKDVDRLRKFVSDKGKILPRRITGTCAKHQREVTEAIKRARHIAFLPYTLD